MKETVEILHQYGGWAVCFFLGLYYLKFYNDFKKTVNDKDNQIKEMSEKHHSEMVAVVRECTGVLTTVNDSLDRFERYVERYVERRDRND